jgi:hypothetical protein
MKSDGGKFAYHLASPAHASILCGKGWFCLKLIFLINPRSMIVKIYEVCEQFKKRLKEWNYWCGAIDPLLYNRFEPFTINPPALPGGH